MGKSLAHNLRTFSFKRACCRLFLSHNNSVHMVLFNLNENLSFSIGRKRVIQLKACTKLVLWDVNYDRETTTIRMLYVRVIWNGVIFFWQILKYCSILSTCQVLFPSFSLINYASSYLWIKRVILSQSAGISGERLVHHMLSDPGDLYHFIIFVETVFDKEHSGKVSRNFIGSFHFWGITLSMQLSSSLSSSSSLLSLSRYFLQWAPPANSELI